jgi:A/G-specific adenine glycosylase
LPGNAEFFAETGTNNTDGVHRYGCTGNGFGGRLRHSLSLPCLPRGFKGGVLFSTDLKNIFAPILLAWFKQHQRDLPWRKGYNPYHVWVSEVMAQQTQMDRVVVYFERFIQRFPTVIDLACADEDELLKLWEGLGYYSRARNLHKAAKMVANGGGVLPETYKGLLSLAGIGPYTANAIMAIGYNKDYVVVDGNVERLMARLADIETPVKNKETHAEIQAAFFELLPSGEARNFNQAMMEFGALVCRPKGYLCGICPFQSHCLSFKRGTVDLRPVSLPPKKTIAIEMACGVVTRNGKLFIQKREEDDVWAGLWEFPGGRLEKGETPEQTVVREFLEETEWRITLLEKIGLVQHAYMHYRVTLHGFFCELDEGNADKPVLHAAQECKWVRFDELAEYGFPAGHRKLIALLT